MIDLRSVWLPQIVRYAELVADERIFRSAWISGERSETSVTGFDELVEQVFDDLDSEAQLELAKSAWSSDPELIELVEEFLGGLESVDRIVEGDDLNDRPERIFVLAEWALLRERAVALAAYAARNCDVTVVTTD